MKKKKLSILSEVESLNNTSRELPIAIEVTRADLCPRYSGICLKHVKVGPSPEWLQQKLILMDQKPINNVVDVTNFILFHYGQPLHAFDLLKIKGQKIKVDVVPEGTRFETLDHQEKKLLHTDLCICNGDGEPMCMAGVMGGAGKKRNAMMLQLIPYLCWFILPVIISVVAGITELYFLNSLTGLIELVGTILYLVFVFKMSNELKSITQNQGYTAWLALIWVYGPCLLFRPEMERAKQARGIQKPARGFVGYFLFPIWAMASDLNELNGL